MQPFHQVNMLWSGTRLAAKTKSNQGLLPHYIDNIISKENNQLGLDNDILSAVLKVWQQHN